MSEERGTCHIASLQAIPEYIEFNIGNTKTFLELHERFTSSRDYSADQWNGIQPPALSVKHFILDWKKENESLIEQLKDFKTEFSNPILSVYIPTLRTLNTFDGLANRTDDPFARDDVYGKRIKSIYSIGDEFTKIFSGLNIYKDIADLLLGFSEDRARIVQFQDFIGAHIFDAKVEVTPSRKSDVLTLKINDVEHPIYDFGDGMQSLLIYTFAALANPEAAIFIDEPELHLHPGIQRKLFKCLQSLPNQFFITTHSNHLLDISLDHSEATSFFLLRNHPTIQEKFIVEHLQEGDELMLMELGCQKSSVFLANSSIWIEGITDRLYIQRFVDEYVRATKSANIVEDIDYAFFEYGGSNIVHFFDSTSALGEAISSERLTSKSFVVFDGDNGRKKRRKDAIRNFIGNDRCAELSEKEIENLLTPLVVHRTLQDLGNTIDTEPIAKIDTKISLGKQIDDHYNFERKYSDENTLARKLTFCRKALPHIKYENMSTSSKELAETIVNFIKSEREKFV